MAVRYRAPTAATPREPMIVTLSLPFALVGSIRLMWWLGFNESVAIAVGFIALPGMAADARGDHADLSRPRARGATSADVKDGA